MKSLLSYWRELLIVILLGVCYAGYKYYHRPAAISLPTISVTPTAKKYTTKTVKVKQTIKTTEPNGKVTEKVTERVTKEKPKSVVLQPVIPTQPLTKWSVGGAVNTDKHYEFYIAHRISTTPFFGTLQYEPQSKSVSAGVRLDW